MDEEVMMAGKEISVKKYVVRLSAEEHRLLKAARDVAGIARDLVASVLQRRARTYNKAKLSNCTGGMDAAAVLRHANNAGGGNVCKIGTSLVR
jgi:hypothetical protein